MLSIFLNYTDLSLFLLRIMVALVFGVSGWKHLRNPTLRAQSIGMTKSLTIFIGLSEFLGSLGLVFGVFVGWASIGLMIIGIGAMWKKSFEWHTGFWGEGSGGWHYDLMLFIMNLVILTTLGGAYVLF